MQFTFDNKIIKKPLCAFYEEGTFEIPRRLGEKNYSSPFNFLKSCYLVRTSAIYNYKSTSDYILLLGKEQFDEN